MVKVNKSRLDEDPAFLWGKYCGFLDLSMEQFKKVQEGLLLEQLELVSSSPLGKRLLRGSLPRSLEDFRRIAKLTKYGDYLPDLEDGNDAALAEPAHVWAHTTGARGDYKFVPYTLRGYEQVLDSLMSAFILGCASKKGEVNIRAGDRVLYNTPPRPFLSGLLTFGMGERFGFQGVLDPEDAEKMEFKEKIEKGFHRALRTRVDVLVSMTSILVKIGEGFAERRKNRRFTRDMLHPTTFMRLARAILISKILRREVMPKDLWPAKAILGWGIDTRFFRQEVARYWGKEPYEFYAFTEGGIVALQAWNKAGMTLVPYSGFYEFIPEEESTKSWEDSEYNPVCLLLDELEVGKQYELVVTSFYGMPFMRYRPGHLVRVVALRDDEAGVQLPQFEFQARCDDRIDLAGFTRLDERTVLQALSRSQLPSQDWIVRNEYNGAKPSLHVYGEFGDKVKSEEFARILDASLRAEDPFYGDLEDMLDIHPLKVTCLSKGTFDRFYEEKQSEGLSLTQRRPLRMRSSDSSVDDLLRLSGKGR